MKISLALLLFIAACSAVPERPTYSSNSSKDDPSSGDATQNDGHTDDDETGAGDGTDDPAKGGDEGDKGGSEDPKDETPTLTDFSFDKAYAVAAGLMATNWTWQTDGLVGWGSTNNFTALVDYMHVTGSREYLYVLNKMYDANINKGEKNFINEFYDDTAWWGLALVRAYDVTKDQKFLNSAKLIADYIYREGWSDKQCGGGIWWKRQSYKSSISNGLYLKLAASLHNRIDGDTHYLDLAKKEWKWFTGSGVIDKDYLIVDGVNEGTCKAGGEHFTYNQGVILGAAAELYKATSDNQYLDLAKKLLTASMDKTVGGTKVVEEKARSACGSGDHHGDELYFKGAYIRNVRELNEILKDEKITAFIKTSAESAWTKSRSAHDAIGYCWQGPFDKMEAGRQTAALDLMTAAVTRKPGNLALNRKASADAGSCTSNEGPEKALDGSNQSKWCAKNGSSGSNLIIDLGEMKDLHRVRIAHAGSAAMLGDTKEMNTKDFEIFIGSSASGPWTSVSKITDNTSSATSHEVKGKAQFVRLHVINAGSDDVIRIYEVSAE